MGTFRLASHTRKHHESFCCPVCPCGCWCGSEHRPRRLPLRLCPRHLRRCSRGRPRCGSLRPLLTLPRLPPPRLSILPLLRLQRPRLLRGEGVTLPQPSWLEPPVSSPPL